MKKKVLAIMLVAMSIMLISACGKKEKLYEIPDLSQYKTDYVGDSSNVINIVSGQEYPEGYSYDSIEIQSETEPYGLTVFLKDEPSVKNMNLIDTPFLPDLPVAQLHWIIADKEECITLESLEEGMKIYDNPVGVLTNNPPFNYQMFNLNNYMQLAVENRSNTFSENLELNQYSRGMGGMGLPGDLSSQSRFVRVAFVKMNSLSGDSEEESVSQFFHILGSVDQQRGCCKLGEDKYEITLYTSCCNTDKGIYYYNTYDNHQISAVDMYKADLDGEKLYTYAPIKGEQIRMQN